jgi:hypothetical protein
MRINYFDICIYNGIITETYINTSENNYISHTEDSVTFTYSYNSSLDHDSETQYQQITKTRVFDVIRQERINSYKELIKDLQDKLISFENATNYDQYKELIYKNK